MYNINEFLRCALVYTIVAIGFARYFARKLKGSCKIFNLTKSDIILLNLRKLFIPFRGVLNLFYSITHITFLCSLIKVSDCDFGDRLYFMSNFMFEIFIFNNSLFYSNIFCLF